MQERLKTESIHLDPSIGELLFVNRDPDYHFFSTVWGLLHLKVRQPILEEIGETFCEGNDEEGRPVLYVDHDTLREMGERLDNRSLRLSQSIKNKKEHQYARTS